MQLRDKVIAIVGGTGGLGLSAARACRDAGAHLAIMGRDADRCRQMRQDFPEAIVHAADAADAASAPNLVEAAVQEFGRLDGLYHVAGGSGRGSGPFFLENRTAGKSLGVT